MSWILSHQAPLAAGWLLAEIGDNFPDSGKRLNWSDLWAYGIGAVVAAVVAAIIIAIRKYNDVTAPCNSPRKLFRELCLLHGLDRASQRLLWQVARASRYSQPAQLFLTPSAFDADRLPADLRDKVDHLRRLRTLLF